MKTEKQDQQKESAAVQWLYRAAMDSVQTARFFDAMGDAEMHALYQEQARWRAHLALRRLNNVRELTTSTENVSSTP